MKMKQGKRERKLGESAERSSEKGKKKTVDFQEIRVGKESILTGKKYILLKGKVDG